VGEEILSEGPAEQAQAPRRPIAARSSGWARWLAARLAASSVTPNQISVLSAVFSLLGGALILRGGGWACWVGAALCVQLRLVCNLLDGMVAVEGGKGSPVGNLYNELPDRISDSLLLVPMGYAAGMGWLGWAAALLAALTAYVRVFGGSLGLPQDFSGIMAKQRRMALLTAALLAQAAEGQFGAGRYSLLAAGFLIAAGSALTCWTRTAKIARRLRAP
jgi:phosphatidylglycerophosphate synthase